MVQPKPLKPAYNLMELKLVIESILFSAQHPLSVKDLKDLLASAAERLRLGRESPLRSKTSSSGPPLHRKVQAAAEEFSHV